MPTVQATTRPFTTQGPEALDAESFLADLKAIRAEIDASLGEVDLAHLRKIERIGWAATGLGLATAWVAPNPFSMAALSLGRTTRWLLMHHIGHRGYDKVPNVPARWTSKVFARGARRFVDFPDWILPEAWIYEHNVLHHSHTGEDRDPDLIERNVESLRASQRPKFVKYGVLIALATSWRFAYYAPVTLKTWLARHDKTKNSAELTDPWRDILLRCWLPYAAREFVLLPAAFLALGPWAAGSVLANSLGAEVLTNLHTFGVVGPNHTGNDLYRFASAPRSRAEGVLRQVLGTANYAVGGDVTDLAHMWLNYQIEHHLWPDLPLLRYREVQPKVKALCAKYGIPYVQESVFTRIGKMLAVAVGEASMKREGPQGPADTAFHAAPPSPPDVDAQLAPAS